MGKVFVALASWIDQLLWETVLFRYPYRLRVVFWSGLEKGLLWLDRRTYSEFLCTR